MCLDTNLSNHVSVMAEDDTPIMMYEDEDNDEEHDGYSVSHKEQNPAAGVRDDTLCTRTTAVQRDL